MMKSFLSLTEREFERFYSLRDHTAPGGKEGFEEECLVTLSVVGKYLAQRLGPGDYHLHEYFNRSRFIEVAFEVESYLHADFIRGLQGLLAGLRQSWMVCLSEGCYLFVTREQVLGFDPTGEDAAFLRLQSEFEACA
jgi:hypothetical protein